jgi:hypothetical protein
MTRSTEHDAAADVAENNGACVGASRDQPGADAAGVPEKHSYLADGLCPLRRQFQWLARRTVSSGNGALFVTGTHDVLWSGPSLDNRGVS